MSRWLPIACLLALVSASPAFAQTHLTFVAGGGTDRGAFGGTGTFDVRAAGIDWHLHRQWWVGVEVGIISGTGHGFGSSDAELIVPINLHGY